MLLVFNIYLPLYFQQEPNCVFAHIDGEENYDTAIKENVGIYPSFRFYSTANKDGNPYLPGKYEEMWSTKNITKFMSVHCGSSKADDHIMDKMVGHECCFLPFFTR